MTAIETRLGIKVLNQFRLNGKIVDLKRARKEHQCKECKLPIFKGQLYYSITLAGSGLGSLKFPDRLHLNCINKHLDFSKK